MVEFFALQLDQIGFETNYLKPLPEIGPIDIMVYLMTICKNKNGDNDDYECVDFDDIWDVILSSEITPMLTSFDHVWKIDEIENKEKPWYDAWIY